MKKESQKWHVEEREAGGHPGKTIWCIVGEDDDIAHSFDSKRIAEHWVEEWNANYGVYIEESELDNWNYLRSHFADVLNGVTTVDEARSDILSFRAVVTTETGKE